MPDINGYVTDVAYLRDFKPALAPAWLDHVALIAGVEPPARQDGFAWCDLGCGQGVTAVILAATHPAGRFYGIDAMAVHIDHARRLAAEAAIPNVAFHAIDFGSALDLGLPRFDYIVAHGVYSWVDIASQRALRHFIDCRLKPGGLAYISYNALPGWACDLPFQRLVLELARSFPGDSAARFASAGEMARRLAGVPSLAASFTLRELQQRPKDYSPAYLVHEFMPGAWQPLYVTEVRAAMKTIGLVPVGSATLLENFDSLVLSEVDRDTLAAIADADLRELVRDFCLDQRFRSDVFTRANRRLEGEERSERLLASSFGLARPADQIRYTMTTAAGALAYDNPASRTIVDALASGPRALAELAADAVTAPDLLTNILTLCAAGDAMPVEPEFAPVDSLNRALLRRLGGPEEIHWLSLPCGTAVELDRGLMLLLRDGEGIDAGRFPGWLSYLSSYSFIDSLVQA